MGKYQNLVVIIPAYNPDEKLLNTLKLLKDAGFTKIIIVNDGSRNMCLPIFEEVRKMGGALLEHSINLGQGRAYKTAFNFFLKAFPDEAGVIQCDADGQHSIEDIVRCADLLLQYPEEFILGVRDFNNNEVPFRSRFGNKCTNVVFKYLCGINVRDTQTGLKGIPRKLIPYLMETPGERFEYATCVLLEVKKRNVFIRQFNIKTIYINGNESSHFNPVVDSIRIYSVLLKYIVGALSAFIIDIILFTLFLNMFKEVSYKNYILLSNYLAKFFSCAYSFIINKKMVFKDKSKYSTTLVKFILLCIMQATISSFSVNRLYFIFEWNETIIKIFIDSLLFFVSFKLQQKWVFKQGREENADQNS